MLKEQQIKALAELDGWIQNHATGWWFNAEDTNGGDPYPPNYLTSYDPIIPLIQKQDKATQTRMVVAMTVAQNNTARFFDFLNRTPAQLCEALLRATGKWIE